MNPHTKRIHDNAETLGKLLGFRAEQEVSTSLLSLRLDGAYHPRIDLLWSLPLSVSQRRAIAWALGIDDAATKRIKHLPVVGLEIEGTQPSTKTLEADIANLAALGAPLGLLVVSERGSPISIAAPQERYEQHGAHSATLPFSRWKHRGSTSLRARTGRRESCCRQCHQRKLRLEARLANGPIRLEEFCARRAKRLVSSSPNLGIHPYSRLHSSYNAAS